MFGAIQSFEHVIIYSPILIPIIIIIIVGIIYGLDLFPFLKAEYGHIFDGALGLAFGSAFFWLPILLGIVLWKVWIRYIRAKYMSTLEYILLEIRLPLDILKSPLAMETFLMSLYQTGGEGTFIDRNLKGQTRPQFSLEIASIEGVVKFYIRTERKFKVLIEPLLYAQYPNIEIHEAPDYTKPVQFNLKVMDLYVTDYALANPDPFPIKTYVDYGLDDENVEEENKVDPINSILEFMGSIGPNQQCWLQIMIRAHKKEVYQDSDHFLDMAKEEIKKIRKSALPEGDTGTKYPNPSKGEQERIAALERSISKLPFDTGIRCIYMGKKEVFNKAIGGPVRGLFRAYGAQNLNSLKPHGSTWTAKFDYPWQDYKNIRQNNERRRGLEAYKRRCYFFPPYNESKPFILNVEELASIFHLPGKVATIPTLNRIPSKKSEAPSNLPI